MMPRGTISLKIFSNTGIILLSERKSSDVVFESVYFNLKFVLLRGVLYPDGISGGVVAST